MRTNDRWPGVVLSVSAPCPTSSWRPSGAPLDWCQSAATAAAAHHNTELGGQSAVGRPTAVHGRDDRQEVCPVPIGRPAADRPRRRLGAGRLASAAGRAGRQWADRRAWHVTQRIRFSRSRATILTATAAAAAPVSGSWHTAAPSLCWPAAGPEAASFSPATGRQRAAHAAAGRRSAAERPVGPGRWTAASPQLFTSYSSTSGMIRTTPRCSLGVRSSTISSSRSVPLTSGMLSCCAQQDSTSSSSVSSSIRATQRPALAAAVKQEEVTHAGDPRHCGQRRRLRALHGRSVTRRTAAPSCRRPATPAGCRPAGCRQRRTEVSVDRGRRTLQDFGAAAGGRH